MTAAINSTGAGKRGYPRSEERFSRNAETDLVCRLLLEKKNQLGQYEIERAYAQANEAEQMIGIAVNGAYIKYNDFFFNDTATTEIYTLSLHDALPILLTG